MLKVLAERKFPAAKVIALASERSAGLTVPYNGSQLKVQPISEGAFNGIDIALFAASADLALMYAPIAAEKGALVDELEEQTKAIAAGTEPEVNAYPYQLAYNVVPGGWRPEADGYNEEEVKIVNETRKILHLPDLRLAATCVRVPVPVGHGESVFVETRDPITPDEFRTLMGAAPGVIVEDDPNAKLYPTPRHVAGTDEVYVGRIRKDPSVDRGLAMWLVSDNIRKGSALNAVQVAEQAVEMGVLRPAGRAAK